MDIDKQLISKALELKSQDRFYIQTKRNIYM